MSESIKPNLLTTSIMDFLYHYTADIQYEVIKLTDEKAEKLRKLIKEGSPKRTEKYSKTWRVVKTKSNVYEYEDTVCNVKHYRRTHLLEKPHVKRNYRGSVAAQPHIKPAVEKVSAEYVEGIKNIIQKSKSSGGGRRNY